MREVKFILPFDGTTKHQAAYAYARTELCKAFGGFTAVQTDGAWRRNGEVVNDSGYQYTVAILQSDGLSNFARFREIALQAGRMAEQEAVYIVGPTGDAEIVSLVDVGKTIIHGEFKSEIHRPQVGDFWETRDGHKVYVYENSSVGMSVRLISDEPGIVVECRRYAIDGDGRYQTLSPIPHPLDLKRFIGR